MKYIFIITLAFLVICCRNKDKSAEEYFNMGVHDDSMPDYSSALINYNYAIKLKPNFTEAYNNRGFVRYMLLRDTNGAISDYDKALQLNPNYPNSYYNRGYVETMRHMYKSAIEDFTQAIKFYRDSDNAYSAFNNRGFCEDEMKRFDEALCDYNHALKLNPTKDEYFNRAFLEEEMGEISKAFEDYNCVIQIDSTFGKAYYHRGLLYIRIGKNDSGCLDLHSAQKLGFEKAKDRILEYCKKR